MQIRVRGNKVQVLRSEYVQRYKELVEGGFVGRSVSRLVGSLDYERGALTTVPVAFAADAKLSEQERRDLSDKLFALYAAERRAMEREAPQALVECVDVLLKGFKIGTLGEQDAALIYPKIDELLRRMREKGFKKSAFVGEKKEAAKN